MTTPMPRTAASPASKAPTASVTLAPPEPLDDLMTAAGYSAALVVSRTDGRPMSAADRARAARVVEASEERDMTDEEATAIGRAELAAAKPRAKRAAAPAASKAARTARRSSASR